jgi:hypothetical protein
MTSYINIIKKKIEIEKTEKKSHTALTLKYSAANSKIEVCSYIFKKCIVFKTYFSLKI